MSLPIFNQPYAIDFHPTDFWGFKTTPLLKTLLIREYWDSTGFHARDQKKKSEVIYEKLNIISYVEVAISYKGITDKRLIKGPAKRLVGKVKEKYPVFLAY